MPNPCKTHDVKVCETSTRYQLSAPQKFLNAVA